MINLEPKNRVNLIKCAMGEILADLCITNVQLVNVMTGEVYPADVYVYEGYVAHVEYLNPGQGVEAQEVVDGKGEFLIPGFIDSHIHIESSMLTPRNFARGVINHGTTTAITDPHEIANVYGIEAVAYMHEASEGLPMRQLINIPSCVPAVPGLEHSGAEFGVKEIEELSKLERVVGLAEVMDNMGVIRGEKRMMDIMDAARKAGIYLQGHAPFMSGRGLSAYAIGGARTCHESRLPEEFLEKMRVGIAVDVRESSITCNAAAGVSGTRGVKCFDNFCVCTDDREADDILNKGHLNIVVRRLIECGMDPILAIKSATFNNAKAAKLDNLGAIAPGYVADMQIVKSLAELKPRQVYFEGKLVSENGQLVTPIEEKSFPLEGKNSIRLTKTFELEDFMFKTDVAEGQVNVNVMTYPTLELAATKCVQEALDVVDGKLDIRSDEHLKYVMVINRYGRGTVGYGVVRGFGSNQGAMASTVSHDCHNITVVFDTPENAKKAVDTLVQMGGGFVCVVNEQVEATIELAVGGLMSVKPAQDVAKACENMKEALTKIGFNKEPNPLLRIVTLALPVIPEIKMSDLGYVDVFAKKHLPLYVTD